MEIQEISLSTLIKWVENCNAPKGFYRVDSALTLSPKLTRYNLGYYAVVGIGNGLCDVTCFENPKERIEYFKLYIKK